MTWDGGEKGPLLIASALVALVVGALMVALALITPDPPPPIGGQPRATAVVAVPRYRYAVSPTPTVPARSRALPEPTPVISTGCRDLPPLPMGERCLRVWREPVLPGKEMP